MAYDPTHYFFFFLGGGGLLILQYGRCDTAPYMCHREKNCAHPCIQCTWAYRASGSLQGSQRGVEGRATILCNRGGGTCPSLPKHYQMYTVNHNDFLSVTVSDISKHFFEFEI